MGKWARIFLWGFGIAVGEFVIKSFKDDVGNVYILSYFPLIFFIVWGILAGISKKKESLLNQYVMIKYPFKVISINITLLACIMSFNSSTYGGIDSQYNNCFFGIEYEVVCAFISNLIFGFVVLTITSYFSFVVGYFLARLVRHFNK